MKDEQKLEAIPEPKTLDKMSLVELKALYFDQLVIRDTANANMANILQEIQNRPQ